MKHIIAVFIALYGSCVLSNEKPCGSGYHEIESFMRESMEDQDSGNLSIVGLELIKGSPINLWSVNGLDPSQKDVSLELTDGMPIILGRQQGGSIDYLDEKYTPTMIMPNGKPILKGSGNNDLAISRAHLMMKRHSKGILLVNGVPGIDGNIRPPMNGSRLLEPEDRPMAPGEELIIERGQRAKIQFPNGTVLLINAN